jgi:Holliday junction resolvase
MEMQPDTAVDRRRKQIAAAYRKQGYRVTVPTTSGTVPAFLHDCHPDLIAEKDGDQVVIEVKRSRALKGANDLTELAERVAAAPGWRLELVALRSDDDARRVLAPDWLKTMLRPPAPGTDIAHHCIYLGEVLDYLIRGTALLNHIRVRDKTAARLAVELAFAGVIEQNLLDRIENAFAWRNALMHVTPLPRPAVDQAAAIEEICRELEALSLGAEA